MNSKQLELQVKDLIKKEFERYFDIAGSNYAMEFYNIDRQKEIKEYIVNELSKENNVLEIKDLFDKNYIKILKQEEDKFPIQAEMTKDDYVIICGDFGGVWTFEEESSREKYWLDWLNERNFTTLFIDGNHENYTRLYNDYPIEEWHGGKVHKIRDSVLHLMRGEIFDIDNNKIFAFGGAKSHDIQDGILNLDEEEKIYEYRKRRAYFRIRDFSWWDLELPTDEEMQNGIRNLEKVNYKVDYIISHCCPTSVQAILSGGSFKKDHLTDYLQEISEKCEFKKWFFGHYHDNKQINKQYVLLYESIIPLEFKSIFE